MVRFLGTLFLFFLSFTFSCHATPQDDFATCIFAPTNSSSSDPLLILIGTEPLPQPNGIYQPILTPQIIDALSPANKRWGNNSGHVIFNETITSVMNKVSLDLPIPSLVVYPLTTLQVARVVRCAVHFSLPLTTRCGGHSYVAESRGGFKRIPGVVVDLAAREQGTGGMLDVAVFQEDGMAKAYIEGGNWLGRIYYLLWEAGNFTLPGGNCPSVGIGGHSLGGGVGFMARQHGFFADHIEEMTVVDAKGDVLTVSSTSHPDLLWAMRGAGGGNYGIVTRYKMKLVKFPALVVFTQQSWPISNATGGSMQLQAEAWSWYLNTFSKIDSRATSWWGVYDKNWAGVTTLFMGPPEDWEQLKNTTFTNAPKPWYDSYTLVTGNWLEVVFGKNWNVPPENWSQVLTRLGAESLNPRTYGEYKSAQFFEPHLPLPAAQLLPFLEFLESHVSFGLPRPYYQLHAGSPSTRLQDTQPPNSAIAWRGAAYTMQYYMQIEEPGLQGKMEGFMQGWQEVLGKVTAPISSGNGTKSERATLKNVTNYLYINYIDKTPATRDPKLYLNDPTADVGGDTWSRLRGVKERYDPSGVWSVLGGVPGKGTASGTGTSSVTASASLTATSASVTSSKPSAAVSSRVGMRSVIGLIWSLVWAVAVPLIVL